jgi:Grx4 family monothiol glutaredoxin
VPWLSRVGQVLLKPRMHVANARHRVHVMQPSVCDTSRPREHMSSVDTHDAVHSLFVALPQPQNRAADVFLCPTAGIKAMLSAHLRPRAAPKAPRPRPFHAHDALLKQKGARLICNRPESRRCGAHAVLESYTEAEAKPAFVDGQLNQFPTQSGVFAVFDAEGTLRFVGISRNISMSVAEHAKQLGDMVHTVKAGVIPNATKDDLTSAWKEWLQTAVDETGQIPPGNADPKEKEMWQVRRKAKAKPEIKLTPGKGIQDLKCDIKDLIAMVVKNEKTVVFIKGTRTQPQCGFSYQMLTTLNTLKTEYEVVNVLDEQYNPGLRDAIKEFSAWPTIPQLYIKGEFVGGADIVQEMAANGELAELLSE